MRKGKKKYLRDLLWFGLGTFFGGYVLGFILGLVKKA